MLGLRLIEPHLVSQALGIETPTFGEGDERTLRPKPVPAEAGDITSFGLDRDLEMMAGHGLVHGQSREVVARSCLGLVRVHVVGPRARAVRGGRVVERGGAVLVAVRLDRYHAAVRDGQMAEELRQTREGAVV